MSALGLTPSQTVGPFLSLALGWPDGPEVAGAGRGGAVWLRGRVLDGEGSTVDDALVETWQADADGRFDHPDDPRGAVSGFRGFGRSTTVGGQWAIRTVKPGRVPDGQGGLQAPHVDVSVFARGLLDRLVTRLYFADEAEANAQDLVLASLPDDAARGTLLAQPSADGYRFDVVLQGSDETVFFRL